MHFILDILRGAVIGLANAVPGVSGGTMMVSMGIYDRIIDSLNNLRKKFKESFRVLLPYLIGMAVAILAGALILKKAFRDIPLPTSALFVGLILGSLPVILRQLRGERITILSLVFYLLGAAAVIAPKVISDMNGEAVRTLAYDVPHMLIYFLMGVIASASMVIPGISGSMMLMIFGYYTLIYTDTLGGIFGLIKAGDWAQVGQDMIVLIPFAVGIVVGLFGVAKLIQFLLKRWKGHTYSAIIGMVVASPAVILMEKINWYEGLYDAKDKLVGYGGPRYTGFPVSTVLLALAALILGAVIAWKLGGEPAEDARQ